MTNLLKMKTTLSARNNASTIPFLKILQDFIGDATTLPNRMNVTAHTETGHYELRVGHGNIAKAGSKLKTMPFSPVVTVDNTDLFVSDHLILPVQVEVGDTPSLTSYFRTGTVIDLISASTLNTLVTDGTQTPYDTLCDMVLDSLFVDVLSVSGQEIFELKLSDIHITEDALIIPSVTADTSGTYRASYTLPNDLMLRTGLSSDEPLHLAFDLIVTRQDNDLLISIPNLDYFSNDDLAVIAAEEELTVNIAGFGLTGTRNLLSTITDTDTNEEEMERDPILLTMRTEDEIKLAAQSIQECGKFISGGGAMLSVESGACFHACEESIAILIHTMKEEGFVTMGITNISPSDDDDFTVLELTGECGYKRSLTINAGHAHPATTGSVTLIEKAIATITYEQPFKDFVEGGTTSALFELLSDGDDVKIMELLRAGNFTEIHEGMFVSICPDTGKFLMAIMFTKPEGGMSCLEARFAITRNTNDAMYDFAEYIRELRREIK